MPSTFITNDQEGNLEDRISKLIGFSRELKFLVGFFYFSGIRQLYESLKTNHDARLNVLVGLNVDKRAYGLVEYGTREKIDGNGQQQRFKESILKALNTDEFDNEEFYQQAKFFIEAIVEDRLIIRKTREPNHAKLYFFKMKDTHAVLKPCCFITGSSNLTRAGLSHQQEFNVEISDYGTEKAEKYFDDLWAKAVMITEDDVFKQELKKVLTQDTLLAQVTPYEAFAFILKTYLDLLKAQTPKDYIFELLEKKGYRKYQYQIDAVEQATSIIEQHGGVIISDVVGLGKSIIAGMVAKSLNKRGIIICPPALKGGLDDNGNYTGWCKYQNDFKLDDWRIESLGLENLEKVANLVRKEKDYEVIIIDEAHRFRNQDTEAYELLSNICRNKIVILLTATPFNNTPADIFSLLKLFIVPGKSNITFANNLDGLFRHYTQDFKRLSNIKKNHIAPDKKNRDAAAADYQALFGDGKIDLKQVTERARYLSKQIRNTISPVTIRRNRIDLKKDPVYSKEIYELSEVQDPRESFFELSKAQSDFYDRVIKQYFGEGGAFKGAIYQPFVYESGASSDNTLGEEENRQALSQKNLYDFMRRLLVKRFESSFGAFAQSIRNFKDITEAVQTFVKNSGGKYILDRKLLYQIYELDEDGIAEELEGFKKRLSEGNFPKHDKVYEIATFKDRKKFLDDIESDLKLFSDILDELEHLKLLDDDPKLAKLAEDVASVMKLKDKAAEPLRKVIVFSEYTDTVAYVEKFLEPKFPGKIITVKGDYNKSKAAEIISNFDTTYQDQKNTFQILLTTDKMSEGVNLNRAGAVINYDIPWNPTRVIQRVGRINRISKKVFDKLYIYNFFPTIKGSSIVKSRQIATEKMFLIHNTLGEDAKIFDADEEPTAARLFEKIQQNPDEIEGESFTTDLRLMYDGIDDDTKKRIAHLPSRVKVAKKYKENNLTVFFRKGTGLFMRGVSEKNTAPAEMLFEDALPLIRCESKEPALPLSPTFWENYNVIKEFKEKPGIAGSEISLEKKAYRNIKTLLEDKSGHYLHFKDFLVNLMEDLEDYKTLSDYTLRRLANLASGSADPHKIEGVKTELTKLTHELGAHYLDEVKKRSEKLDKEIIVAVENLRE